jgi:hypothetical protein
MNPLIEKLYGLRQGASGGSREKFIAAKDVLKAFADYAEKERFPTAPRGVIHVDRFMDIEIISHKDMPDGEMILVPYDANEDIAVKMYLASKKKD